MEIKSVKVWKNPTKTEARIYATAADGRQGCLYKTTTRWHNAGDVDGNLTEAEWKEARRVAVWGGKWHTVYENEMADRIAITEPKPAPVMATKSEPEVVKPGRKIISDGQEYRFANMHHHVDQAWFAHDDSMWIVTDAEQGIVDTEDGPDYGWFHTVRPAAAEEVAEYQRQKAEWEAKTPEERISEMLDLFPELT